MDSITLLMAFGSILISNTVEFTRKKHRKLRHTFLKRVKDQHDVERLNANENSSRCKHICKCSHKPLWCLRQNRQSYLKNPDEFELILTEQMIEETIASLNKPRIIRYLKHGYDPESWMKDISSLSNVIPDFRISFNECRDPVDVVYLAAANSSKARFIVSGDRDLTVLKRYTGKRTSFRRRTSFFCLAKFFRLKHFTFRYCIT